MGLIYTAIMRTTILMTTTQTQVVALPIYIYFIIHCKELEHFHLYINLHCLYFELRKHQHCDFFCLSCTNVCMYLEFL